MKGLSLTNAFPKDDSAEETFVRRPAAKARLSLTGRRETVDPAADTSVMPSTEPTPAPGGAELDPRPVNLMAQAVMSAAVQAGQQWESESGRSMAMHEIVLGIEQGKLNLVMIMTQGEE